MNETFKPFDKVLVRDGDDEEWMLNMFSHYDETARKFNFVCLSSRFKNCIPYEGNKELLGTTNEPKQKRWRAEKDSHYWFIDRDGMPIETYELFDDCRDTALYNIGNYFRTKEEAEAMANKIKALLIGE